MNPKKGSSKNSSYLPVISQEAGLLRYLEEVKKFPVLTEKEEHDLAIKWYEQGDVEAAQKLVTSHLRLVVKMAMQFRGYGLPVVDIISEGNIGLMTAVKKFDPHKGYRLATYAMWWIKAQIQDYILKSWSLVKMGTSAAHKKLFFNLRKVKNKILHANKGQIPYNEIDLIANELELPKEDVAEMNERFTHHESSLNEHAYSDNEDTEVIDLIAEPSESHENSILEEQDLQYKRSRFYEALQTLNDREREIFLARRMSDPVIKLEELSKKYGVSNERIRQIEERSFQKIQEFVSK
jgi:RNA polymerase sigma-32 factor